MFLPMLFVDELDEILILAFCKIVESGGLLCMTLVWTCSCLGQKGNVERNWENIDENTQKKESNFYQSCNDATLNNFDNI